MHVELTTVADVNVTDYTKYKIGDRETVDLCKKTDPRVRIGSIDTTLALIRAKTDPASFLFIAGIANELGFMNRDVSEFRGEPQRRSRSRLASSALGCPVAGLVSIT